MDELAIERQGSDERAMNARSKHSRLKKFGLISLGLVAGLALVGWAGLQITPASLPEPDVSSAEPSFAPLPGGLPAPVEQFYLTVYGSQIPVVEGVIISGRGTMRIAGITLPVRFRFAHDTGQAYRHHIEVTWFGRTISTVHETFFDGVAQLDLPVGSAKGPKLDQGANLALWAEAIWMPAIWATDERVRWEPVDDDTAVLIVPFGTGWERISVRFDPLSHLITQMESMRFKAANSMEKTLWINTIDEWDVVQGSLLPIRTSVSWGDERSPWAQLTTESILFTADIDGYLHRKGK